MGHFKPMVNLIRRMTCSRIVVDGAVEEAIRNGSYKPRHHPGRTAGQIVDLDQRFTAIANHIVSYHQLKNLKATAQRLYCVLSKRQLPLDIEELDLKRLEVEEEIVNKLKTKFAKRGLQWPPEEETDEERERRLMMLKQKVNTVLQSRVYHWKPILYDTEAKCASYMLARLLPNYAVAIRVLGELKRRMKEFQPKTIFDFASGVGSCYMACRQIWPDCIREVFMVDTSGKMNDLALRFMDSDDGQKVAIAIRQFLPALSDRPYDLVFAAYALMETADWEQRRLLLENLWQKSDKFLVLIEYGTKAGHRVLMEARDYLLNKFDNCTVFSPCPHEKLCPRLADSTPCNFAASYVPLRLPNARLAPELELYSYVTLRKVDGTEPKQPPWPRVVRTPLRRHKHIWCDLCTSSGSLQRTLFTKKGSGQHLYRIAKATTWGDLMPVVSSAAPEQTNH